MLCLITGGSGSGKSAYGETLLSRAEAKEKFYIATMEVFGREDRRRVERHRQMRAGKGFITIERARKIEGIWLGGGPSGGAVCLKGTQQPSGRDEGIGPERERPAALLESLSDLAANELFGESDEGLPEKGLPDGDDVEDAGGAWTGPGHRSDGLEGPGGLGEGLEGQAAAAFRRIQKGILHLREQCGLLVVVTDAVFSDGTLYPPETEAYIRLLGRLNAWTAGLADQVTEVVCGIPLQLKAGRAGQRADGTALADQAGQRADGTALVDRRPMA